jgi:hypothetical protein
MSSLLSRGTRTRAELRATSDDDLLSASIVSCFSVPIPAAIKMRQKMKNAKKNFVQGKQLETI